MTELEDHFKFHLRIQSISDKFSIVDLWLFPPMDNFRGSPSRGQNDGTHGLSGFYFLMGISRLA
jgi:hypothetical protein